MKNYISEKQQLIDSMEKYLQTISINKHMLIAKKESLERGIKQTDGDIENYEYLFQSIITRLEALLGKSVNPSTYR